MLLTFDNAKTPKGEKYGVRTAIMYLAPEKIGGGNVCASASEGCKKACLYTAGHGRFDSVQQARIRRKRMFFTKRTEFMNRLSLEIAKHVRYSDSKGLQPCVRLNGTSDIPWERIKYGKLGSVMDTFPHVQFYDYTKRLDRLREPLPSNYHLTFSRSESNEQECLEALALGYNVAVVFNGPLPDRWHNVEVIDGDEHDIRFMDKPNSVVGLKAKGEAKKDTSNFVVDTKH